MKGCCDGSFNDTGKSGCGVVIEGVDRKILVTVSKIAVPLTVGTALTGILDLVVSTAFSTSNDVQSVEFKFARCERHRMRACLQFGVESVRTAS